ncbi:Zinc finger, RING/FYVE/PHD-type [Quillaja saponaria]|uniref:Zinc finger, RING/FYVE/PHD-type n=1 Tax=Quillaja saponaria TaxID=32244 RepID=A0AAD7PUZ8_QUISA|nr:Zinc finger, RING/FYVE/PHD-type [Quillaja saponaria]
MLKGYMIPWNLAPILKALFNKYGDISKESELSSPKLKGIVFFYLCWVVNRMCKTIVAHVSENDIRCWFYIVKAVQDMGFNVNFAVDRFKRVGQAYIGFQTKKRDSDILVDLDETKKIL